MHWVAVHLLPVCMGVSVLQSNSVEAVVVGTEVREASLRTQAWHMLAV